MARPDRESGADEGVRPALQRAQEGDQRGAIVGGQLQAEAVAGDGVGRGAGEPVRGAEGGKPENQTAAWRSASTVSPSPSTISWTTPGTSR
jgi:hypothetical protein